MSTFWVVLLLKEGSNIWYTWNSPAYAWSALHLVSRRWSVTEDDGWVIETVIRSDRDRILPASADYYESLHRSPVQKRTKEESKVRETKRHCRWTVLRSIIDDPTCICGARHVLKPVSRSVPRIICAQDRIRVPTRLHSRFLLFLFDV